MHTHAIPHLLLVGLTLALLATGLRIAPTAADTDVGGGVRDLSESESNEDVFVQACEGFAMTTSYTINRTRHAVTNYSGDVIFERLGVTFVGVLANAENGQSLPYDGKFTRTSDYHRNLVTITDFELRIQLPTPGDFTLKIARQEMDLVSNPVDVIHAVAQSELESGICVLLGRAFAGSTPGQDDITPWTELD
jgi:hypothetical protein